MDKLLLLAALISIATAHVCLLNPHQRGSMVGINQAAAADCYLRDAPCGSRTEEMPSVLLPAGRNVTISFQKNLAHYNTANPGSFVVAIQTTPNGAWKILTSIPDDTLPSLTLYNLNVVLPAESSLHAVLQVQYISNAAPGTFYQCADISLGKV